MNFKILLYLSIFCLLISCKKEIKKIEEQTMNVTAESSLKFLLPEILEHFNSKYPKIKVNVSFKPEILCKKDIYNSKVDLILNYSKLKTMELNEIKNQFGYVFENGTLAFDGLVLITNKNSTIDSLNKSEIKKIILDNYKNQEILLEDLYANANLYYLVDEFNLNKNELTRFNGTINFNSFVQKINTQKNIIGFTSSLNLRTINEFQFVKTIRVKGLKSNIFTNLTKENINNKKYPFIRPIFYVLKHNFETPATWLVSFMLQERGQLIFKRNCTIPILKELEVRKLNINF